MKDDYPQPDNYDEKEVYAYFGLAAYAAQVLEKGLVNMVVTYKTFGLPIIRAQFDEVFSEHDSKTIGQLLVLAKKHGIPIPDSSALLLDKALKQRNYLNHDFFADHAGHWTTLDTRKIMIDRLCSLIELFRKADRVSEAIYHPIMKKMGVTENSLEEHKRSIVQKAKEDQNA